MVPTNLIDTEHEAATSPDLACGAKELCPLCEIAPGQRCRLESTSLEPDDAAYLQAIGLHESCEMRLCRQGRTCVVDLTVGGRPGARIALCRSLARKVVVGVVRPDVGGQPR